MISTLLTATFVFMIAFIPAPLVDIEGICEPVFDVYVIKIILFLVSLLVLLQLLVHTFIRYRKQHLLMSGYTMVVLMS